MIPATFDYRRAESIEEAVRILSSNENARLLAGGHSLLPMMKLRIAAPAVLVDIGGIEELRGISAGDDALRVGAMTTHAALAESAEVRAGFGALAEAAASIGDVQVRNCGTLGGSLAHADPAADYGAAVLALDAVVDVVGAAGNRSIPIDDLFAGLLTTNLEATEIITEIRFHRREGGLSVYEKFAQPASGFAIVGVAVALERDDDGRCTRARLAATGISDRPLRLTGAEAVLEGSMVASADIEEAAAGSDREVEDVRSDMYAAEDYRRHLLRVLAGRALTRVAS